jgi:sugar O-acyltransferase (sialic acid O-acetyltransferase NeuD family)
MNLVIIGGGNQASYTVEIIEKLGSYKIVGIIDSVRPLGSKIFGYRVIGRQNEIRKLIHQYSIDEALIAIGDNWDRYQVHMELAKIIPDLKFASAIHPSAIIGKNVSLGEGVIAMAGCIINTNCIIGDFTFFATGAQVEHNCQIENYASISAGSITGGYVKLGTYSAVAMGVTIIDRIEIGSNSLIGSGSLVMSSIPPNVLAYGSPAKVIRMRTAKEKFLK